MPLSDVRLLVVVCCIAIASVQGSDLPAQKSIINGPVNDAFIFGEDYTLNCEAGGVSPRVQWVEFATLPEGRQISDNDFVLPGHPESARYEIDNPNGSLIYNLIISDTVLTDGGTYQCSDYTDFTAISSADIITLDGYPNCTTNIPENGYVREGVYYTVECVIGYRGTVAPEMTWSGPDPAETSAWNQAVTTTSTSVWSGVNMNMSRYFDAQTFSLLVNFTEAGFNKENFASNVPAWNYTYSTPQLYVQWAPTRLYIAPERASYEIGQTVECYADSNPSSEYFWRNLDTQEVIDGNVLTAREDYVGTSRMQCRATNEISGVQYFNDFFFNFTVNARTTTPIPTTPTTTTPPPAEAPCDDLTGRWTATSPSVVDLCIEIDNNRNGRVIGLLRNASDPYFVEVRGRVTPNSYNQIGFAGVWPINIGSQAFNGICRKCYGVETLQITAVARKITDNPTCLDQGPRYTYENYAFSRTGPPCRTLYKQYNIQL